MKKLLLAAATVSLLLCTSPPIKAQTYVNMEWVQIHGAPDTIRWSTSTLDIWGQLITVGNTVTTGQHANIITVQYDGEGSINWQREWNGPQNSSDYGSAVITDGDGYIYVAGAGRYTTDSTFDIILLKYDHEGYLQWDAYYNSGAGQNDIPTAIALDDQGNIYLTGTSERPSTSYDFVTLKFNESGDLQWATLYDYNNLVDIAASIVVSDGGEEITVMGGSERTLGSWDYTTVLYDAVGFQVSVERQSSDETDIKKPKDLVKDDEKNYFITGIQHNGSDYDVKLMKLDSTLQPIWVEVFDEGHSEGSNTLAMDENGNLIIGGWVEDSPGVRHFLVLMYDNDGTLQWNRTIEPSETKPLAEVTGLQISGSYINIVGVASNGYSSDIITAQMDMDGEILWIKTWEGMGNTINEPTSISASSDEDVVYVTGQTTGANGTQWVTIKYSFSTRPSDIILDTTSQKLYKGRQLLIWFNPSLVDKNFVDNKELEFSELSEVIPDSVRLEISDKSDINFGETPIKVYKLMTRMTSDDTISISRLGDTVRMKPFWSVFIVEIPNGINLETAADSLSTLTEYIIYAGTAKIGFTNDIPNDNLFLDEQSSLFANPPSPPFPNAHINVEPTWDIEHGRDYIKVGVFDFSIFWAHPDFGDGTYLGSKIFGGWDWPANSPISSINHPLNSHGTAVAGIIGALRNNGEGIAGIAGGDVQNNNTGVQLFSMGIGYVATHPSTGQQAFLMDGAAAISAIIEGAAWNPSTGFGYGLHVQNHSWAYNQFDALEEKALESCWHNQCVFVAGRGNDGNNNLLYPACHRDELVINVGASGTDGEHFDGINVGNGDGFLNQQDQWRSSFGGNIDVIAPGVTEIVSTLHDQTVPYDWNADFGPGSCIVQDIDNNYTCFHGTSAAAPHVSGLVALMLSHHHPNNGFTNGLAPEDVETLIQNNATDIAGGNQNYPVGYDQWNGWGRIDAHSTMEDIEFPRFSVFHNSAPSNTSQTTAFNQQIFIAENINGIAAGYYMADRIQVTASYLDVFSSTSQILDQWSRPSSSIGYSAANPVFDAIWANYTFTINNNVAAVTTTTFCWYVKTSMSGQNINKWIPAPPQNLRTNYSLHLFDPNATSIEDVAVNIEVAVYPIPAENQIILKGVLAAPDNITIQVHDMQGRVLTSRNLGLVDKIEEVFSVKDLPGAIYLITIQGMQSYITKKFIKQ